MLSLPGPALLVVLGACLGLIDIFYLAGWKAPFRLSSTAKGEPVHPKLGVLQHTAQDPQPKPLRLTELRLGTGVLIVTALAAGMAILIYLKSQEVSLGGWFSPQ